MRTDSTCTLALNRVSLCHGPWFPTPLIAHRICISWAQENEWRTRFTLYVTSGGRLTILSDKVTRDAIAIASAGDASFAPALTPAPTPAPASLFFKVTIAFSSSLSFTIRANSTICARLCVYVHVHRYKARMSAKQQRRVQAAQGFCRRHEPGLGLGT